MRDELIGSRNVAIIGAGFIGLEVAAVARTLDKTVTVIEAADVPLAHVLGETFGRHLRAVHERRGVQVITGASVTGLSSDRAGAVQGVDLADGRRIDADLVLVAIGSVPEIGWLKGSGLDLSNGVVCDATCAAAGVDGVVAAGDVASWHNPRYNRQMRVEHWTNAIEQGTYAAQRLLGLHDARGFESAPYFWSDQFGARIQSIGSSAGYDRIDVIDQDEDRLLVTYGVAGQLVSVAGMSAGTAVLKFRSMVLEGASMDEARAHGESLLAKS